MFSHSKCLQVVIQTLIEHLTLGLKKIPFLICGIIIYVITLNSWK